MARMLIYYSVFLAIFFSGLWCEETEDSSGIEYAVSKIEFNEDLWNKSIAKDSGVSQVLLARPENRGSVKDKPKGTPALNDFGFFDLNPLIASSDDSAVYHVAVNELDSDCKYLEECREKLLEVQRGEDHDKYDFFVSPDGKIVGGEGWAPSGSRGTIRIGFPKLPSDPPTQKAMEAFAFLIRTLITSKSLSEDAHHSFNFTLPDGSVRSKWKYSNMFDSDLSLTKLKVFGDVEYLARGDWGAVRRIRRLNGTTTKADLVKVRPMRADASTPEKCLKEIRRRQREQMIRYSDLFANFLICGDGRIYEGLGWDISRKEKTVYIDILGESEFSISWTQVLAAFSLTLREGIRQGKISEDFAIEIPPGLNDTLIRKITAMGLLAKSFKEDHSVVTIEGSTGESIPTSDHVNEEIYSLEHPVSAVRFIQKSVACEEPKNCIPFVKRLGGEAIVSSAKLTSNFYFVDDNVVFEGLGWGSTNRKGEVALEFPTMEHQDALPSNQSMYASMLLIREGVINGYLKPDYTTKLGKDTSVEFKNMIRFWNERIRG